MQLKGPSETLTVELNSSTETTQVKDLLKKLPSHVETCDVVFISGGMILSPEKSLKECNIDENSVVRYLTKTAKENVQSRMDISKRKASPHLPTNINEVVKSFRVLIDQYGLPFGEKLKQLVQNTDSFAALLSTVPGLQEDEVAIKMLKDMAILKHYVKKENVAAMKADHPALICAINQINITMTSDIDTLSAMQTIFGHSRDGYDDEYEDEDGEDYGADDVGNFMDFIGAGSGNTEDDEAMDVDGQEFGSNARTSARGTSWAGNAPNSAGNSRAANSGQRLTADLFSQAFENVLARRNGSDQSANASAIPPIPGAPTASEVYTPPPELVRQLCELGIAENRAVVALTRTKGNFNAALDLLFSGQI